MNRQQIQAAHPPDAADTIIAQGVALARQGRFAEAVAALNAALKIRPHSARAHNTLGLIFAQQSKLPAAVRCFASALDAQPDFAEAANNLGKALAVLNRQDEAIASFRRATNLDPGYAEAFNNLGIALTDAGQLQDAIDAYRCALRAKPNYADAHNNLSIAHRYAGDLQAAIAACEAALACAPTGTAYLNLANLKRFSVGDPLIAAMEAMAELGSDISLDNRIALHFALGKAHDDCGNTERAFAQLFAGNALKRATIAYDEAKTLCTMQRIAHIFSTANMRSWHGHGVTDATPIFILGMPRSGSTLLEQILSAHPEIFGAGERTDFSRIASAILAPDAFPEAFTQLQPQSLRNLARTYLDTLQTLSNGAPRVTDKMPGNFLYAGLIHLALPKARILHTRRNAADTCFSCFSKLFRAGHAYSFDLGELGRYYKAYQHLMAHWRGVIPASIMLDVDYESVIADPEGEIRRILAHCGLPWNPSCLNFHHSARPVQTASATQIRAPLHPHAIARAAPYQPYLRPLNITGSMR